MAGGEAEDSRKPKTKADSCFQPASPKLSVGSIQGHLKISDMPPMDVWVHVLQCTKAILDQLSTEVAALAGNVPNVLKVMSISMCLTTCYLWK